MCNCQINGFWAEIYTKKKLNLVEFDNFFFTKEVPYREMKELESTQR